MKTLEAFFGHGKRPQMQTLALLLADKSFAVFTQFVPLICEKHDAPCNIQMAYEKQAKTTSGAGFCPPPLRLRNSFKF